MLTSSNVQCGILSSTTGNIPDLITSRRNVSTYRDDESGIFHFNTDSLHNCKLDNVTYKLLFSAFHIT